MYQELLRIIILNKNDIQVLSVLKIQFAELWKVYTDNHKWKSPVKNIIFTHIQCIKLKYHFFLFILNPNPYVISSNYKNQSIFKTGHSTFLLGCLLSISCGCFSTELLLFRNMIEHLHTIWKINIKIRKKQKICKVNRFFNVFKNINR